MTAPTAEDVIARAIHDAGCGCTDWHPRDDEDPQYDDAAAAVVAAVRAMNPAQQAELIGGTVERGLRVSHESPPQTIVRVVGTCRDET